MTIWRYAVRDCGRALVLGSSLGFLFGMVTLRRAR